MLQKSNKYSRFKNTSINKVWSVFFLGLFEIVLGIALLIKPAFKIYFSYPALILPIGIATAISGFVLSRYLPSLPDQESEVFPKPFLIMIKYCYIFFGVIFFIWAIL